MHFKNNNSRKELIVNNRLILLSTMLLLALLALPLTGCENPPWETGRNLVLNVDTPKDGLTVDTPTVAVSGRVVGIQSKGAKVSVNGAEVPVKDLKFSTDVTLTEGKNVINIGATNGTANLSQQVTVTYVPAKK
jgi:hypothetical protein